MDLRVRLQRPEPQGNPARASEEVRQRAPLCPQCGGWRRCLRTQRAQKARQKEGEGLRLPSWGICVTLSVLPIPSGLAPPLKGDKSMELTGQL